MFAKLDGIMFSICLSSVHELECGSDLAGSVAVFTKLDGMFSICLSSALELECLSTNMAWFIVDVLDVICVFLS